MSSIFDGGCMTAEIAIINRSGIAVAADSAATIGRKKVWKSANKLFSMGPFHDIGIMFYGSADLFGCHWEIIVKQFREEINNNKFHTVEDVCNKFKDYIKRPLWHDEKSMQIADAHLIAMCVDEINNNIEYDSVKEFRSEVCRESKELCDELNDRAFILNITKKAFSEKNREIIKRFSEEIFGQRAVKSVVDAVENYVFEFSRRAECKTGYETGVVVFGYGDNEIYPSLQEIVVDGISCGEIRIWSRRSMDLNKNRKHKGAIIPFAQTDVASLFMEGISALHLSFFFNAFERILDIKDNSYKNRIPDSEKIVESRLREKENEEILSELKAAFDSLWQNEIISPVIESIHSLPKDEMAAMAEAFVELTSMRRKVDSHLDTVGGAVDVGIISKGEGFVWIKRKTYFDAQHNPDYASRKRYRLCKETIGA